MPLDWRGDLFDQSEGFFFFVLCIILKLFYVYILQVFYIYITPDELNRGGGGNKAGIIGIVIILL